jgi:ADP-ribose pyrophosphatase
MHPAHQDDAPAPWLTLSEGPAEDWKVMQVRHVERRHARDGRQGRFTVADAPVWVNILPLTTDGKVICVEQFRHGTGASTIEIPGGIVHDGEDPRCAAERECLEETGWGSATPARLLGIVEPNPAFMRNRCHVFVWEGCERRGPQQLDQQEDIRVHEVPMDLFVAMVKDGRIAHALVLSALALYRLHHESPTTSAQETTTHE